MVHLKNGRVTLETQDSLPKIKFVKTLILSLFTIPCLHGQHHYSGIIINQNSGAPLEYVNIGIKDKNIGTVSDANGKYVLWVDQNYIHDTIIVSCIGYLPLKIVCSDFIKLPHHNLLLQEGVTNLKEVMIHAKNLKPKTLGISTTSRYIQAGFKENKLGYECGVIMRIKKAAILQRLILNFSVCTYDTVLYRINIYKVLGKLQFKNQLNTPIYLKLPKNQVGEHVVVDLKPFNIMVEGNFLISLEQVKDLGKGYLYFCAAMTGKTFHRATSQGIWEKSPVGISMSVEANVEK